jgi:hypothetical protein
MNMYKHILQRITFAAILFSMLGFSTIQAQNIQDSAICYGYGTDLQPIGIGNTLFQYTEKVGFWVQIQNPVDAQYRIVWEEPSGSQYRNTPVTVIEKEGEDWGIVFDSINIAESTAKNKLGIWKAVLYIDGEIEVESEFQLINYNDLLDSISGIQEEIEEIISEKDTLASQNAALETSLEDLQADYAELESQVGTSSDYEELQENYDSLVEDYEKLKDNQSSTKTMLYASIIVALVAVVVAVYFGVLKK